MPSTRPFNGQPTPHKKKMAVRPAWRVGRALYTLRTSTRTISSSAIRAVAVDVVEKVAVRMLAQREALLQNVSGSHSHLQLGAPGTSRKIKDMEALHKTFSAWKEQVKVRIRQG